MDQVYIPVEVRFQKKDIPEDKEAISLEPIQTISMSFIDSIENLYLFEKDRELGPYVIRKTICYQ